MPFAVLFAILAFVAHSMKGYGPLPWSLWAFVIALLLISLAFTLHALIGRVFEHLFGHDPVKH